MVAVSLLRPIDVRRLALLGFAAAVVLVIATLAMGDEVNGARRWLNLGGVRLQPSELLKPSFVVVTAWIFAAQQRTADPHMRWAAIALLAMVTALLVAQPDIGMAALVIFVWMAQFFLAGMPLRWLAAMLAAGVACGVLAYAFVPHVTDRVDRFLFPGSGENYQVERALEAFQAGGALGRGPGEGVVKYVLPDAHADFIFAVAAEEYGMIACLLIAGAFAFVVLRGFSRLLRETDYFVLLAGSGLLAQLGLQAGINMGVNLHLLPAKGMTLPFISYGGSSLIALTLGMGMVLALTRRRATPPEARWLFGRPQV
jgi:cell division protein FtsW